MLEDRPGYLPEANGGNILNLKSRLTTQLDEYKKIRQQEIDGEGFLDHTENLLNQINLLTRRINELFQKRREAELAIIQHFENEPILARQIAHKLGIDLVDFNLPERPPRSIWMIARDAAERIFDEVERNYAVESAHLSQQIKNLESITQTLKIALDHFSEIDRPIELIPNFDNLFKHTDRLTILYDQMPILVESVLYPDNSSSFSGTLRKCSLTADSCEVKEKMSDSEYSHDQIIEAIQSALQNITLAENTKHPLAGVLMSDVRHRSFGSTLLSSEIENYQKLIDAQVALEDAVNKVEQLRQEFTEIDSLIHAHRTNTNRRNYAQQIINKLKERQEDLKRFEEIHVELTSSDNVLILNPVGLSRVHSALSREHDYHIQNLSDITQALEHSHARRPGLFGLGSSAIEREREDLQNQHDRTSDRINELKQELADITDDLDKFNYLTHDLVHPNLLIIPNKRLTLGELLDRIWNLASEHALTDLPVNERILLDQYQKLEEELAQSEGKYHELVLKYGELPFGVDQ